MLHNPHPNPLEGLGEHNWGGLGALPSLSPQLRPTLSPFKALNQKGAVSHYTDQYAKSGWSQNSITGSFQYNPYGPEKIVPNGSIIPFDDRMTIHETPGYIQLHPSGIVSVLSPGQYRVDLKADFTPIATGAFDITLVDTLSNRVCPS
jgi:hypothetical protein